MRVFVRNFYFSVNGSNAGFINRCEFDFKVRRAEQFYLLNQFRFVHTERDECAQNHIAARARETIEVKSFHSLSSDKMDFNIFIFPVVAAN